MRRDVPLGRDILHRALHATAWLGLIAATPATQQTSRERKYQGGGSWTDGFERGRGPTAPGRVEPKRPSSSSPQSCPSAARCGQISELRSSGCLWPSRAKAEFKLAAVNQSSEAGQQGRFRADHQRPVMAVRRQRRSNGGGPVTARADAAFDAYRRSLAHGYLPRTAIAGHP